MSEILTQRDGAVATVTLNRPDRYNALTSALRIGLARELGRLEGDDDVHVIVLTGAGRAFCSGQDIGGFEDGFDLRDTLEREYNPLVELITGMPKVVIAAINGPAAGAGLGLALACDLRVMAEDAFLSCAFVGIGLVPDSGTASTLVRAVGYQRALEIAVSGRRVAAAEARSLGLVLTTCPAGDLAGAVAELAATVAAGPSVAIGLTKQLLRAAQHQALTQVLEEEIDAQEIAIGTADFREGIAAFLEKRAAAFQGR